MCDMRGQRLEACLFSGRFFFVHVNQFLIRDNNRSQPSALRLRGRHARIAMVRVRSSVRRIGKCCIEAKSILLRSLEDARNAKARKSSMRRLGKRFALNVACRTGSASFWRVLEIKR